MTQLRVQRHSTASDSEVPSRSRSLHRTAEADEHWVCLNKADEIVARCSLWWRQTPPYEAQRIGLIGHFAADDCAAAHELLTVACAELKRHDCTMAVGPMDGSTWQSYRVVTERGAAPPFFLEPDTPDEWAQYFGQGGFAPLAEYFSTIIPDLRVRHPRLDDIAASLSRVTIRAAHRTGLADELRHIYAVAAIAFQPNFLYTPISEEDFLAQYEPLRPYLQPELVLLAEHEGRAVGFLFALPDFAQTQRGETMDTFIVKTVAALPEYSGLGSLLVARSHEVGASLGFRRAIHALMHEDNKSRRISRHYSQPLRRYALFGKRI